MKNLFLKNLLFAALFAAVAALGLWLILGPAWDLLLIFAAAAVALTLIFLLAEAVLKRKNFQTAAKIALGVLLTACVLLFVT